MVPPEFEVRLREYTSRYHVQVKRYLGGGTDGEVWESSSSTAIKVLQREIGYYNERDSYLRLEEYGVTESLDGFWIPKMVNHDDELLIVEMDMMHHAPYIIDFAKVRIDSPPDFSEDVIEQYERDGQERFGHNWPKVKSLMAALESFQIYYTDPRPGNIGFPDMP